MFDFLGKRHSDAPFYATIYYSTHEDPGEQICAEVADAIRSADGHVVRIMADRECYPAKITLQIGVLAKDQESAMDTYWRNQGSHC